MKSILKLEIYDGFRCTGGSCDFTCCEGWDIVVDDATHKKWETESEHPGYLLRQVISKQGDAGTQNFIKMGHRKCCPFLNESGLCSICKEFGEDYMPETCRKFPRQENRFGKLQEFSLSCGCPEVVEMINRISDQIKIEFEGDRDTLLCEGMIDAGQSDTVSPTAHPGQSVFSHGTNVPMREYLPPAYAIREAILNMIQNREIPILERFYSAFNMLLNIKNQSGANEESAAAEEAGATEESSAAKEPGGTGEKGGHENTIRASITEINDLFLDVVQNYRNEESFGYYLHDIAELAETLETDAVSAVWDDFKAEFSQFDGLLENCMVSKVFGTCISDDIEEMIMSFQMAVTEYVMVRYSCFLIWLINGKKKIEYDDVRDYIVAYSRIIGYNIEGMKEFWDERFEKTVWEPGYMLQLIS